MYNLIDARFQEERRREILTAAAGRFGRTVQPEREKSLRRTRKPVPPRTAGFRRFTRSSAGGLKIRLGMGLIRLGRKLALQEQGYTGS